MNAAFVPLTGLSLWKHVAPLVQRRTVDSSSCSTPTKRSVLMVQKVSVKGFKKSAAKPMVTVEGDSIQSTPFHRAMLASFMASTLAVTAKNVSEISTLEEFISCSAAVVAAYVFTDFAVGCYHHAVDNYGSAETPIFGYQIAAFQGHHSFPWTITSRDVANNLYRLTFPLTPQMLLLLVAPLPQPAIAFYSAFLAFILLSQETHRQAHMTRSAPWVRSLQSKGLIIGSVAHGKHHRDPFESNYCILSGIWNKPLDDCKFFRRLEAIIYWLTGVEPICWSLNSSLKDLSLSLIPDWMRRTC